MPTPICRALSSDAGLFAALNEQVAEQLIKNGFRNIVVMGDLLGGGQKRFVPKASIAITTMFRKPFLISCSAT